ncbi:N-acetylmuramoyl-L-alanine amidase [Paracoccus aminophilus]|uniref:N-acetylmuramoyl-L-alanine amidase n=1 Tax=Paracoccus aminophilus JCM 7686 TaxID=1367847 RepID=S5YAJ5_PARAH|nr:N-acetylmuramoyl-L-alanine amidase [Paracoccus aminophilus]AGT08448.1 N-acetylmuramoyl-L-alanine amidase [Paracoccus aminophilus JCM 7686]
MRRFLHAIGLLLALALPLAAQEVPAEPGAAKISVSQSAIAAEGRDRGKPRPLDITVATSRAVPFRTYFLADPPRLVVDFRDLDFRGAKPETMPGADQVPGLRWGNFREGWSRLVVELAGPYAMKNALQSAENGASALHLRIEPVKDKDFVVRPDALAALWDLPQSTVPPAKPRAATEASTRPLRIAIDPGHGGIDPGAQVGAISEAAVMLGFTRELTEVLQASGFEVIPTRIDDSFVPLERRMTKARAAGADLFLSFHADALPAGQAAGATIYIWNSDANDRAADELASRHDRDDILSGVDLTGTDDEVAQVLMDLARTENHPRSESFAKMLAAELSQQGFDMHRRPVRGAAFSVLKSPDIPSVLIELGFLTDASDRANLFDPDWRGRMSQSIARAIGIWSKDEAKRAELLRK